ncbi:MAG: helix-turn-helix transcriptional regulator [Candidatus Gottesmanbacteria bacterium]|nr:helix-turn-helix transcriptional regulator [Candidatus Gottesmanbacteria bacterium]
MSKAIYTKEQKDLIQKLKSARLSAKLDQKTAAKRLNKSQSYISKMESGQRRIDLVQLKQIAQAYSRNIDYFIK